MPCCSDGFLGREGEAEVRCWELGRAWWVVRSGLAGQPAGRLLGKHCSSCFPPGLSHKELSFLERWSPFSILVCLEGSCLLV